MMRWNNDYNIGAHPAVLKALADANDTAYPGYGLDEWCERAAREIRALIRRDDADVHFLSGGTQANLIVISAALRPHHSVISAASGHINDHETGAVENTGHKIQAIAGECGKLTARAIDAEAERYRTSDLKEHITRPKLVYISYPTEQGTIYSLRELEDIRAVCGDHGMYLFIDGARMGYGLGARECDVTLADIARVADAFYIGGTKCGAMFGEAVVLTHDALKDDFRSFIKQNGGMLAKGWLLGLQFCALLKDGLYFEMTRRADEYAMRIREAFASRGVPFKYDSPTNQQFVILTREQADALERRHIFEHCGTEPDGRIVARFCTAWSTRAEDVDALVEDIEKM